MDDVARLPGIKPINLVHVQCVQLHLGVTTKANISTSDGIALCDWALAANDNPHKSIFFFPRQERQHPASLITQWANG
jgi:hypothetical protein